MKKVRCDYFLANTQTSTYNCTCMRNERKIMLVANYSEFRTDLKKYLDAVEKNDETLIIKRGSGKGTVLISLDEYNSMMETAYLLSTRANRRHLEASVAQLEAGQSRERELIEE